MRIFRVRLLGASAVFMGVFSLAACSSAASSAPGGSWTAHAEGMAGIAGGTCSVQIPPALVALWRWQAGACHPTGV
jgi:hypothetical protein